MAWGADKLQAEKSLSFRLVAVMEPSDGRNATVDGYYMRMTNLIVDGCFFFQAEDGIRYYKVTGVQTCALPILKPVRQKTGSDGRAPRLPNAPGFRSIRARSGAAQRPARSAPEAATETIAGRTARTAVPSNVANSRSRWDRRRSRYRSGSMSPASEKRPPRPAAIRS